MLRDRENRRGGTRAKIGFALGILALVLRGIQGGDESKLFPLRVGRGEISEKNFVFRDEAQFANLAR
eukprot:101617-Amorphochlora_amoeboformis.AAC.1